MSDTFSVTLDTPGSAEPKTLLATAIGECLAASLRHCLAKARVDLTGLTATVRGSVQRNASGRLRIAGIGVTLSAELARPEDAERFRRCVSLFEDFCTVTASVREGIPIEISVEESVPA